MAEQSSAGANAGNLYFIVGGLVVAVGLVGYLVWGGHIGGTRNVDVKIETPAATPAPTPPTPAPTPPTMPVPPMTPQPPKT